VDRDSDMHKQLKEQQIRNVLEKAGLGSEGDIEKIEVGFSNDVYSIANRYILKVARHANDERLLEREVFLCKTLKGTLPVPEVLAFDTSKKIIDRVCIVYEKIQGKNLYDVWYELNVDERRAVLKEICSYLKVIHTMPYEEYTRKFDIDTQKSWREYIISKTNDRLSRVKERHLLSQEIIDQVRVFLDKHDEALNEEKQSLVYHDAHFDNFIIQNGKVVGMLDFERVDYMSIDYALDIVQRMQDFPKKYASENAEKFIRDEDYRNLMRWYKEFYPDLFDFKDLNVRLALYAIYHDLQELIDYPNSQRAIEEIERYTKSIINV